MTTHATHTAPTALAVVAPAPATQVATTPVESWADVQLARIEQEARTVVARDLRDEEARDRDRAATRYDATARRTEAAALAAHPDNQELAAALIRSASHRQRADQDRQQAAADRRCAAADRTAAAKQRRHNRVQLRAVQRQLRDLTSDF